MSRHTGTSARSAVVAIVACVVLLFACTSKTTVQPQDERATSTPGTVQKDQSVTPVITPVPTSRPTSRTTPIPPTVPPGLGAIVQGNGLYMQLIDVEFHTLDSPEDASVRYTIRFVNQSTFTAPVSFSLADVRAVDSGGVGYSDYYGLAEKTFPDLRCVFANPDFAQYVPQLFDVPPGGEKDLDLYLSKNSTEGQCGKGGGGVSRVDIETDYIDVTLGTVKYRTDQAYDFLRTTFRLQR